MGACIWTGNNRLHVSRYQAVVEGLDPAFDGLRVVQISDLHGKSFGEGQGRLAKKVEALHPDIILCTGDMVDSRRYRAAPALTLVERLAGIAPVYVTSGNHEWWTAGGYKRMIPQLEKKGAVVLENKEAYIERDGKRLRIVGVTDPDGPIAEAFYGAILGAEARPGEPLSEAVSGETSRGEYMEEVLPALLGSGEEPVLLLSHRPEYFDLYVQSGADVVFAGHAHGGQIRLPFIGGLIAPGQGAFPRYDGGVYREGGTSMVVSRGLGNSLFPVRALNPPDVVLVTIRKEE